MTQTLFYDPELTVESFQWRFQLTMSIEFSRCADEQLTNLFVQRTGLKPSKQVSVALPITEEYFSMSYGDLSRLSLDIYINHNWNPVWVTWRSSSGRVYQISDADIDCQDIIFDFEGLDPALYHKQLYPGEQMPFKLKNLGFELEVFRLNMDATLVLFPKTTTEMKPTQLVELIDDFINRYNQKSEKRNRKDGLVHNWKSTVTAEYSIRFDLDLGSAGPYLFKELLPYLSKLDALDKVLIE